MPEFPRPIQLPGQPPFPREPYASGGRHEPPTVVDEDADVYGAEEAAMRLTERLRALEPGPVHAEPGERPLLTPPLSVDRDRIEGPASGRTSVVVFGAHGTPASRSLGAVLDGIRERHVATVGIAWRHYPDPDAHPRAAILALAVEAAAVSARFWTLTRDLLRLRHHDPRDLHGALVRSWLDPAETLDAMRAGVGADRIVADVSSAQESGVVVSPTLFIDGERFTGDVERGPVLAAVDAAVRARAAD
jgi:2-hydroxychromene-2-carboxylate isomerase